MGVVDEHMECLSLLDHVGAALSDPFFLSVAAPIPSKIHITVLFLRGSSEFSFLSFWNAHRNKLDTLISETDETEARWRALIPTVMRPVAAKLKLADLTHLTLPLSLGGAIWWGQFLFGFPSVGDLSQRGFFPISTRETRKKPEKRRGNFRPSSSRFYDREAKS